MPRPEPSPTSNIEHRTSNISLIAAMGRNRVIGRDGQMPWHLPDDLKYFKQKTLGHTVIMGRKTWDAMGRMLPNRRNVVVSRNADFRADGAIVVNSLDEALRHGSEGAAGQQELFVIGGEQIYRMAMEKADRIYLTRIDAEFQGDAYFPEFDERHWRCVSREPHPADERHAHKFAFEVWERQR